MLVDELSFVILRVELLATKNPENKIHKPISNVTANARSLPRRPAKDPLAESTIVPVATRTLPIANRFGDLTMRTFFCDTVGVAFWITLNVDHSAPKIIISAGTPEPTAARIRGVTPNN